MCQNIDDFNRGAAIMLARLYQSFPIPIVIQTAQLDECADVPADLRPARRRERAVITSATLGFLADEGFLRYTDRAGPEADRSFSAVRLTSKGLAALSRTPDVLEPVNPPLGDRLIGWIGEGTRETLRQVIGAVLGG
jgi:hypothetical protein